MPMPMPMPKPPLDASEADEANRLRVMLAMA